MTHLDGVAAPRGQTAFEILHEDDDVRVVVQPGAGPTLHVTFSHLDMPPTGEAFWAQTLMGQLGLPALGVVAKRDDWFPAGAMTRAEPQFSDVLGRFGHRLLFGTSMGAYGAIKYSRMFQADSVLAVVPQCSIDPADTAAFDVRFAERFDPARHAGMRVGAADVAGRLVVIYDPLFALDRGHVQAIEAAAPGLSQVPAFHMGHECYFALRGSETMRTALALVAAGELDALRRLVARQARHTWPKAQGLLKQALVRGSPKAAAILERWGAEIPVGHLAYMYLLVGEERRLRGDPAGAVAALHEAVRLEPGNAYLHRQLSWLLESAGDLPAAWRAAQAAVDRSAAVATFYERRGRVELAQGRLEAALGSALTATALDASAGMAQELLSVVCERLGHLQAAAGYLDRAITLVPAGAAGWSARRAALAGQVAATSSSLPSGNGSALGVTVPRG